MKYLILITSLFFFFISPLQAATPGDTLWAKTVNVTPDSDSVFSGISSDSNGDIFAGGYIVSNSTFDFGNGATASGTPGLSSFAVVKYKENGDAQWAKSATGPSKSYCEAVASDSSGNSYAVGGIGGTGAYDFGNGVTASPSYSGGSIVLVKYNSNGDAQWAKTVITSTSKAAGDAIALDNSGNIYVAGSINVGTFDFGDGVTVSGSSAFNLVLVKYNSSGTPQWAKSVGSGTSSSRFYSVVASGNNIYAAGTLSGTNTISLGNGVTVTGAYTSTNVVLVKYDSSGNTQWAETTDSSPNTSQFGGVALDSAGNPYAVGSIRTTGSFNFGDGVTISGINSGENAVLVKYNSTGSAQWAKSVVSGSSESEYESIVLNGDNDIYTVGQISGNGAFGFGNNVTASGAFSSDPNVVIVKYNSLGDAAWAKSLTVGPDMSEFKAVALDKDENPCVAGYIYGNGVYDFGNNITAQSSATEDNVIVVKYFENLPSGSSSSKRGTSSSSSASSSAKKSPAGSLAPGKWPLLVSVGGIIMLLI